MKAILNRTELWFYTLAVLGLTASHRSSFLDVIWGVCIEEKRMNDRNDRARGCCLSHYFTKDSGEVMGGLTALLPGQASSARHLLSLLPALAPSSAMESGFAFILHLAFPFCI